MKTFRRSKPFEADDVVTDIDGNIYIVSCFKHIHSEEEFRDPKNPQYQVMYADYDSLGKPSNCAECYTADKILPKSDLLWIGRL